MGIAATRFDGTGKPGSPTVSLQNAVQQMTGNGLAKRTGDTDQLDALAGIAGQRLTDLSIRNARILNDELLYFLRQQAFTDDASGAAFDGLVDVIVAIEFAFVDREKQIPAFAFIPSSAGAAHDEFRLALVTTNALRVSKNVIQFDTGRIILRFIPLHLQASLPDVAMEILLISCFHAALRILGKRFSKSILIDFELFLCQHLRHHVRMVEEDFDIDSLANYLHLTPDQIRKMANRDRLPGRRVSGGWKFSRAEIHHWLEQKIGAADESGLDEVERVLNKEPIPVDQTSDLTDLLSPERIAFPLQARTKNSVIERICEFSAETGALWQPKEMAEAIRRREQLHPTALENGVALLHPRRPQPNFFGDSFLTLAITTNGIPFGGPRGVLTDIFFLIASSDEAIHLRILARLSRLIYVEGFLENLRSAADSNQIWQLLVDAESFS